MTKVEFVKANSVPSRNLFVKTETWASDGTYFKVPVIGELSAMTEEAMAPFVKAGKDNNGKRYLRTVNEKGKVKYRSLEGSTTDVRKNDTTPEQKPMSAGHMSVFILLDD